MDTSDGTLVGLQDVEPFVTYTHAFDHVGVIGTFVDLDRRRQGLDETCFRFTGAGGPVT